MKHLSDQYVPSFQAERYHRTVRYHWMVCCERSPEQLVSWGHAPTQETAEAAARAEVADLISGVSRGGQAISRSSVLHYRQACAKL